MRNLILAGTALAMLFAACEPAVIHAKPRFLDLHKGSRIVLVGNGLGSRMLHSGTFETGMHLHYPELHLFIRNMCDEGNTPGFRPHSGRREQLAFPGAKPFHAAHTGGNLAPGIGHFETEDQWLTRLRPEIVIGFFVGDWKQPVVPIDLET